MSQEGKDDSRAGASAPLARVVILCLAILSAATAVIHFAVAGEHFQEWWVFGVLMLVAAWGQLLWAVLAVARPSRRLLIAGAVFNAGIVIYYVITRTAGDMIGPTPHDIEPLGFGDGLCTVLEAVVVAGCAWLYLARPTRWVNRDLHLLAPGATAAAVVVLLSVALVDGGPEMVMQMGPTSSTGGSGTSMPGMNTASIHLPTTSPAGDITMPSPDMQMMPGMSMASSKPCVATPTQSQDQAAVRLVNQSWKDASQYRSLAAAEAAGYRPLTPTGAPVVHYISPAFYRATVMSGPVLNPEQPQSLVYANTPKGAVLAAVMYITSPGGPTPQPGGCLTQWHIHTNLCFDRTLHVVGTISAAHPSCPAGSENHVTQPMIHVWFVPIPGGPTAIDAPDAQVVHAAEQVPSPANGPA